MKTNGKKVLMKNKYYDLPLTPFIINIIIIPVVYCPQSIERKGLLNEI